MKLYLLMTSVAFAACSDDPKTEVETIDASETSEVAETVDEVDAGNETGEVVVPVAEIFAFAATPGQSFSDGPFPNDGLIAADGTVDLAPLGADARFASLAKAEILTRTDAEIATKKAFGFVSSVFFPMNAAPDLASFEGAVHFVALSGPEVGTVFPGMASWFDYGDYLAVFPAWGHYLVPGAKYAVVIDLGVKTADGRAIVAPQSFSDVIATSIDESDPTLASARAAFADLRDWLAVRDQAAVIGTVFTTEATLPFVNGLFDAIDDFTLVPPSANIRYQDGWTAATPISGAALDGYFGVPAAPFLYMPTAWGSGARADAAAIGDATYAGGSFRGDVGYVVNGTLTMPAFNFEGSADGKVANVAIAYDGAAPRVRTRVAVPFTTYLCTSHLKDGAPDPDKRIPFAVFAHGGSALRADALPSAVANCAAGYATVAIDMTYHGGRQEQRFLPDENLIVPTRVDSDNAFSGKKAGEDGFVADGIGDNAGATVTVGGMFALASGFDPGIIEANLISVATDNYTLVRYLKDTGPNGLGAFLGTQVDADHLVLQGLSFGTSFTTALAAASDDFAAVIQSVGAGGIFTINLPMAPNNAVLAGGIVRTVYELPATLAEINTNAYGDPMLALAQWLSQRGDPQGYAPFALRHRQDDHAMHVFGSGDSWDETLFSPAQLSFASAWGLPVFTAGAAWTLASDIPGAATVEASPYAEPLQSNLSFEGRVQSAAYFYNAASCHAQTVTPICTSSYEPPYPPALARATPLVSESPVCALQAPAIALMRQLLAGETPSIGSPNGTCADLYAP